MISDILIIILPFSSGLYRRLRNLTESARYSGQAGCTAGGEFRPAPRFLKIIISLFVQNVKTGGKFIENQRLFCSFHCSFDCENVIAVNGQDLCAAKKKCVTVC